MSEPRRDHLLTSALPAPKREPARGPDGAASRVDAARALRASRAGVPPSPEAAMALQSALGNGGTARLLQSQGAPIDRRARPIAGGELTGAAVQRAPAAGPWWADARPSSSWIRSVADAGTRGPGGPLPHLEALQRALPDHDLRRVRAHTDGAAARASKAIGADAFAFGDRVAFRQRSPSLRTAAHEAAHVLQQRAGVQLEGGVGEIGDPYERNADAIADAVITGRTPPPVLGGGGGRPAIQRLSKVGEFVEEQRALMAGGRDKLVGKHTTVGFEFEFATMADGNPFSGLSHVELAKTPPMPDPRVPFVLETDASNALELVSPPFWIPTFGDKVLPEPDRIAAVIGAFKERLGALTADEPTVDELVTTMAQDDGIEFTLGAVPLARENLTPRTQEGLAVKDAMVLKTGVKRIKLAPITKFGAEIDAQVNIATDAFGNDLLNQAFIGDRFSGDQEIQAFAGLERDLVNILYAAAFKPRFGWDRKVRPFAAAQRAVDAVAGAISWALKDAKKKLRERATDCYDEPWCEDFFLETTSDESLKKIEKLLDPALCDKLKAYNITPLELSLLGEQIAAAQAAVVEFISTSEAFLDHASGPVKESGYQGGDLAAVVQAIDTRARSATRALARVPHIGGDREALRIFLNALARTLSGQLAVGSIEAVREAQEARLEDPTATMGKDDASFKVHQYMSSRVKDVRGVWAKAPVLDIGLGLLSFKDWETVSSLVHSREVRRAIAGAVRDVALDYVDKGVKTLTLEKASIEPLVVGVVDGIKDYIDDNDLLGKSTYTRSHTVKGADRREMKVGSDLRPEFMTHDPKLMSPRQDTFVPLAYVQMPEIWADKSRQFVVESRTNPVETLRRIKRLAG